MKECNNQVYYIQEDKSAVQDFYAGVISKALQNLGYSTCITIPLNELKRVPKDTLLIAISHYTVCRLYLKGYRKILYWIQGSSPDESFMRNHSYTRKLIISAIEYIALRASTFCFMVSESMMEHFKKKYNRDFSKKTYIMPCFNSYINKDSFLTPGKYERNVFCYVGGLSVWQCFPETVDIYKKAEEVIPNAFFKVFTGDTEKAESILKEKGVANYSVEYVKPDELVSHLSDCKYGFIIRKESPVNFVATPTKLSNYMAAGLIPVVSDTVGFFSEILSDCSHSVIIRDGDITGIIELSKKEMSAVSVYDEYKKVFDTFYNVDFHVNNIKKALHNYL